MSALRAIPTRLQFLECVFIFENASKFHVDLFVYPGRKPAFRHWHRDFDDVTLKTGSVEALRLFPGKVWGKSEKEKC